MRLFETPGLVESNSPKYDLFFDIEEEETTEIMTETMEQYMSKTRGNYGGLEHEDANEHIEKVLEIIDLFHIPEVTQDQIMLRAFPMSLNRAFLKELRENTFSGLEHEDANEHIEKVLEIIDLFHIPEVTQDQIMLRAFPMSLNRARHEENSNIIKEIRDSTDGDIRNQRASIKTLEIQIGQISKVLQERGIEGLPGSTEPNPRDHAKSISTADSSVIRRIGSGPYAVLDVQYNSLSSKEVPFPYRLHGNCCDNWKEARASVSVMPFSTYSNLGLGDLAHTRLTIELADRAIKHPKGIAENVLVRIGNIIFPIDFVILDILEDDDDPL
nr:leucine-rich repeat transmembrane protein kinase protein [Tanacetum cinerariifolium]